MIHFDHEYRDRLKIAWEHFIVNKDFDFSFIRPEILESWKRSRDFDVNPYETNETKTALLNNEDIDVRLNTNSLLIKTVRPYMEQLYSIVEGSGFYLMLCDKEGYILDLIGDEEIIAKGKESSLLVIGANRGEAFAGTNAIGTCLAIKRPIQIWNGEHYILSHKKYACSAAPIFNTSGSIIGCLNLTGMYPEIHTHTLGMVLSAVDGITKEMKIRNAYDEIEIISAQRNKILESVSSGLILLDGTDKIIQINGNALKMLNLTEQQAIGFNIFELINFDDPINNGFSFSSVKKAVNNKETTIFFKDSRFPPMKFNINISFVGKESDGRGTVIRLEESKHINRLVNKMGGFKASFTFENIVGNSPATKGLLTTCEKASQSLANVLVLGESGTGKELVAQSIHNSSACSSGPFVAINCGALPKGLIESELFGYEGGAFTGASKEGNPGKFELADGGTIFLDEIGDMPLDVQVNLLRVLETKEVLRIGGKYPKKINVRIIAATHQNLVEAIEEKTFREDLYYRLNVLTINVPPLRERGNDILELADYFVQTLNNPRKHKMHISQEVYPALMKYPWPGNIRELENAIERAINITDDDEIRLEHLPHNMTNDLLPTAKVSSSELEEAIHPRNGLDLKTSEYHHILSSLEKTGGNIKEAADLLGISRRTLYRKMDRYRIEYQEYRQDPV